MKFYPICVSFYAFLTPNIGPFKLINILSFINISAGKCVIIDSITMFPCENPIKLIVFIILSHCLPNYYISYYFNYLYNIFPNS